MRRFWIFLAIVFVTVPMLAPSNAAVPGEDTVSSIRPVVRWTGGPLTGTAPDPPECTPLSCDEFALTIAVPASYWAQKPGGVVIRIQWLGNDNAIALHVYDAAGREVAGSPNTDQYHTESQQAYLAAPPSGTYRVLAMGFAVKNVSYEGQAQIVEQRVPQTSLASNTMRFGPPTFVDPQIWAAEPILTADRARIFVAAPWGANTSSFVWRSSDEGRTFEILDDRPTGNFSDPRRRTCGGSLGGFDSDVVVDRNGRVYFSDLYALSASVGSSADHGNTWACQPAATTGPELDRQWLATSPKADGDGPEIDAYLAYRDLVIGRFQGGDAVKPVALHVDVTRDGGLNWRRQGTYATGSVTQSGRLFTARDGTLYHVFYGGNTVWLARSADEGRTFTLLRVSERLAPPGNVFVSAAVDDAGNLFVAWVDAGSFDVLFSSSKDKGVRWSAPVRVNPPVTETAIMPWVAAGRNGDVAISWYGAAGTFRPDLAPPDTPWRPWVARSSAGASPSPVFQVAPMSQTPTHLGPICQVSGLCVDRLADFFAIAIAADGAVVAAYNDNGRKQSVEGFPGPYVVVSRQVAGLGMKRSRARAPVRWSEPAGDARFPPRSAAGRNLAELDFTGRPSVTSSPGSLKIAITIGSATDLTNALDASNSFVATDAYWIVLWKTVDRVEYAGMHVDSGGTPDFFGGDEPVGVHNPEQNDKYASYPPKFVLTGRVIPASGVIEIDIPREQFHLVPGDTLHGFQAFSMTAQLQERTAYRSPQLVDSTPAQTIALGGSAPARVLGKGRIRPAALPATGAHDPSMALMLALMLISATVAVYARMGKA